MNQQKEEKPHLIWWSPKQMTENSWEDPHQIAGKGVVHGPHKKITEDDVWTAIVVEGFRRSSSSITAALGTLAPQSPTTSHNYLA